MIQIGFRHSGHAHHQGPDGQLRHAALQARQALAREHRFHLVRRTGQQQQRRAGFVDPLPGRGAAIVGQDLGAFDDERLPLVHLRHLAAHLLEAQLQLAGDLFMEALLAAERLGDSIARDVVLGGPQPPGDDHNLGAAKGAPDGVGEPVAVVAHHALGDYLHTESVQLIREV